MEKKIVSDPENYYQMVQPFGSAKETNEAINNFYEEVGVLRKKHKIPDVLIVVKGSVKYEDGQIGEFINKMTFGSSLNELPMSAFAYGQCQSDQTAVINKLLAGKGVIEKK